MIANIISVIATLVIAALFIKKYKCKIFQRTLKNSNGLLALFYKKIVKRFINPINITFLTPPIFISIVNNNGTNYLKLSLNLLFQPKTLFI